MASLNELIARWLLNRLRTKRRDQPDVEVQALTAALDEERRRVKRLKVTARDREDRHSLLKVRHEKLKAKLQEVKEMLHATQNERDDAQTERRLEAIQKCALEWETGRGLSRPGIAPLAGSEEKEDWTRFSRNWRTAWAHTMRLGVLRQHEPRPAQIESFPERNPPGEETTWPKVSIVTPSYQQADFLERTIQSVLTWIIHEKRGLSLARIETSMQATKPCQTSPVPS